MRLFRKLGLMLALAGFLSGTAYIVQPIAQSIGQVIRAQNGTGQRSSISGVTDTEGGLYFGSAFTGIIGHFASGSKVAYTPSLCNGCTLTNGSDDKAGTFLTTSNSVGVVFGTAYNRAPSCIVMTAGSTVSPAYTTSTTALHFSTIVSAATYHYLCVAKAGG